jgi:hypothetical protein
MATTGEVGLSRGRGAALDFAGGRGQLTRAAPLSVPAARGSGPDRRERWR